jgi:hypothetical protein
MPSRKFSSPTTREEHTMTLPHDRTGNQKLAVRAIRAPELAFRDHIPSVPHALEDGLIPVEFLDPSLTIHAPLVTAEGYLTIAGDIFVAVLDGTPITDSTVTYKKGDKPYVELHIAKTHIDTIADGAHEISYRVEPLGFGQSIEMGTTKIYLDRTPAGGRRLGRMKFDRELEIDGISLSTLLALPSAVLSGEIPDYDGIDPRDTIRLFMKHLADGVEVEAGTADVVTDGTPINALFDRATLETIPTAGSVDFYYRIVNAAGLTSDASAITTLNLSITGSPEVLGEPVVLGMDDGLLTDADVRPRLVVHIPPLTPQAFAGDTVQLNIGGIRFAPIDITMDDLVDAPLKAIEIDYATLQDLARTSGSNTFSASVSYIHRRAGVVSHSAVSNNRFDLTLPGGWDPKPETEANEALAAPILRGATGSTDNVINFSDSTMPATVIISNPASGTGAEGFAKGDTISVALDDQLVGDSYVHNEDAYPISIAIPSSDLNAHAGTPDLSYTVKRKLSTTPHVVTAKSPAQRVRIDSSAALPGGGKPLKTAVFLSARERESEFGSYLLIAGAFVEGFTTLRLFQYVNMSIGDQIAVTYTGFDMFDGGTEVPGANGLLRHEVSAADLAPKVDPDPITGDAVYVDLLFPIEAARRLEHGHFEFSHRITNSAGEAASEAGDVLVSVRFP